MSTKPVLSDGRPGSGPRSSSRLARTSSRSSPGHQQRQRQVQLPSTPRSGARPVWNQKGSASAAKSKGPTLVDCLRSPIPDNKQHGPGSCPRPDTQQRQQDQPPPHGSLAVRARAESIPQHGRAAVSNESILLDAASKQRSSSSNSNRSNDQNDQKVLTDHQQHASERESTGVVKPKPNVEKKELQTTLDEKELDEIASKTPKVEVPSLHKHPKCAENGSQNHTEPTAEQSKTTGPVTEGPSGQHTPNRQQRGGEEESWRNDCVVC